MVYPLTDGCFHLSATVNPASDNRCTRLFKSLLSVLLGADPGGTSLEHMNPLFKFLSATTLPWLPHHLRLPPAVHESLFPHILTNCYFLSF